MRIDSNKKLWAANNLDKLRAAYNRYNKRHPQYRAFVTAKRRAQKIQATPIWLTQLHWDEIAKVYESCPAGYHVDHIVPLNGKEVSGLHVPWNLQILPAEENLRKNNKLL